MTRSISPHTIDRPLFTVHQPHSPAITDHQAPATTHRSWRATLRLTLLLLVIWFIAGPLLGILLADRLNAIRLAGAPLGFWIAQQGSIYVFVILIFGYAFSADRSDRRAGVDPRAER